jgi:ATP-dependent Clp protease ATP-binding subunit ClpC
MFERFTDRARRVVVLAQAEARALEHDHVGTEHVLLGLVHEGRGVAAKALESLGIGLETVRQRVEEVAGRGEQAPSGRIPFTAEAKQALKLSLSESRALGHHYIGTEHLLLALLQQAESVPAQVLSGLGADLDGVREQVVRLLDEYRRQHGDQTG